jgi:OmpA-OmpF porin, OOP family
MKRHRDSVHETDNTAPGTARTRGRAAWSCLAPIALVAAAGCGGTTTFQDTTPIRIAVAAPEPPPKVADAPPPKKVELRNNRIEISDKIQFALDKSEILPVSFGLLDEVAKVIQENPHVQQISIEGHASDEGDDQYNLSLSKARAEAVRVYLTKKGVAQERLSSTGLGETKPLMPNDSPEGREKNRRVEFHVTKQENVTEDTASASPKTVEKTSKNEGAQP